MSAVLYPGTYRDAAGEEAIVIRNDGKRLSLQVRGVDFAGNDFDMLEPVGDVRGAEEAGFNLDKECLCSFELFFEMPMAVVTPEFMETRALRVHFVLGAPRPDGRKGSPVSVAVDLDSARDLYAKAPAPMLPRGW